MLETISFSRNFQEEHSILVETIFENERSRTSITQLLQFSFQ